MIEEHKIKETREVEVVNGLKITCSECGKIIADLVDDNSISETGPREVYPYYKLMTGHKDWGNDSVDSIDYQELCSDVCVVRSLAKFLKENKGSNTAYYELNKCCCRKFRDWKTGRWTILED